MVSSECAPEPLEPADTPLQPTLPGIDMIVFPDPPVALPETGRGGRLSGDSTGPEDNPRSPFVRGPRRTTAAARAALYAPQIHEAVAAVRAVQAAAQQPPRSQRPATPPKLHTV